MKYEPYVPLLPSALWPVVIFYPAEGRGPSWPEWLVTNRDGLPARRRSPIPVLTAGRATTKPSRHL